jgi:hypothetical protein
VKRNPVGKGSSDSKREQTAGKMSQRFTSSELKVVKLTVRNMTSNSLRVVKKKFFVGCRKPK